MGADRPRWRFPRELAILDMLKAMQATRRFVLASAVASLVLTPIFPQPTSSPEIVFVCEHGAAKSVIAAAHFNKLAEEKGLPYRAIARGVNPDASFAPAAVAGLQTEGLSAGPGKPELVSDKDIAGAAKVVTLGCKLPHKAAVTDWPDVPSVSENYRAASQSIQQRVEALVNELAASQKSSKR